MKKSTNSIGKHGLTGNSGFVSGTHISAPYDCNGKVFVCWTYHHRFPCGKIETFESWKRMTHARAMKEGRQIIGCSVRGCKGHAVSLDHHYPYYIDHNLCAKHAKKG